jgi:hypothetical protein
MEVDMFGIGVPELIVIFILLFLLILPIWLSLFLRKQFPGKIWLGLLLSFIFTPLGQLYLEGAILWIILLFICHVIIKVLLGNLMLAWLLTMILSSMIMYYRLLKANGPKITA